MDWFTLFIFVAIGAVVFGLVIAGMAVGVIFSNRRIKGSCGGLGSMKDGDGNSPCMVCGGSPTACDDATRTACDVSDSEADRCDDGSSARGAVDDRTEARAM